MREASRTVDGNVRGLCGAYSARNAPKRASGRVRASEGSQGIVRRLGVTHG